MRRASPYLLAALLAAAGVTHLLRPEPYVSIVPRLLPAPRALVYLSGLAELGCAAGLCFRRTRAPAAWATAALFVAVFPANVQMALDAGGRSPAYLAAVWGRVPLQVPLVLWAVRTARSGQTVPGTHRDRQGET